MYLDYWGFKRFPFENVPDPSFFFLSKSHQEALTRLNYAAMMRKGGAMLSGGIGCGKTLLTRVYMRELGGERYDIALVINPRLDPTEFLQEVLYQFKTEDVPATKVQCLRRLRNRMIENEKTRKETLLIIDEAQLLSKTTLEEIRLLLNYQSHNRFLITVILIGQPELRVRIKGFEQLDQRIGIRYHLAPFDFRDTVRYVCFRQQEAGRKRNLFSRQALEKIYKSSQGVPRKINNLCELSLLIGFTKKEKIVHSRVVEEIINDGTLF